MAEGNGEIEAEIGGQKIRARGYRLIDLLLVPMALLLTLNWHMIREHAAYAQDNNAAKAVQQAIKESNAAMVQVLKESNASTVEAIKLLAAEQKKTTKTIQEVACLSDPAMRGRLDAREFCKRMVRSDQ
jgi:hypothetical protein